MSGVLRWEKPPTTRRNSGRKLGSGASRWEPLAAELRSRPGEWALISEAPVAGDRCSGLATQIRMGQMVCWSPAGDFDAVSQRTDGIRRVWAVYVGGDE